MTDAAPTGPQQIADPEFPDLLGVVGGPLIPCKVVEFTATMAPTTRVEAVGDLDAHYEQTQRYVIRYQPAPRETSSPELWESRYLQTEREPTGWVSTVCVGGEYTPEHAYVLRAYREAHGLPIVGMPAIPTAGEVNQAVDWWRQDHHVEVTTGEPNAALYFVCQNRHPLALRTTTTSENGVRRAVHHTIACPTCEADGITEVRLPDLDDEVPERERLVHDDPELAEQIREGIAEAERGETADLGSFAQHLDEGDDDDPR